MAEQKEGFLQELKRRHVIRAGVSHIIVFALLIQVADVVMPYLGFVEHPVRWALVIGLATLPVTLLVSWFVEHPWHDLSRARLAGNAFIILLVGAAVLTGVIRHLPDTTATANRVAVIPFEFPAGDKPSRFASRALALGAIALLQNPGGFDVIHYESASSSRLSGLSPAEIADQLDVDFVLNGTVAVSDEVMQIRAELSNRQGQALWNDAIDDETDNLQSVQEELAAAVAIGMGSDKQLISVDTLAARRCWRPQDASAMQQYYTARHLVELRSDADQDTIRQAIEIYQSLSSQWPEFAEALAGHAWALYFEQVWDENIPDDANMEQIEALARDAYSRCDSLGEALVFLPNDRDHPNAFINTEQQTRLALEMQPGNLEMSTRLGEHLRWVGRNEEAIAVMRQQYRDNPFSVEAIRRYAFALQYDGRTEEAIALQKKAEELGHGGRQYAVGADALKNCGDDIECWLAAVPEPFAPWSEEFRVIYVPPTSAVEQRKSVETGLRLLQENPWMLNWINGSSCRFEHLTDLYFEAWNFHQQNDETFWFWPNVWRKTCVNVWADPRFQDQMRDAGILEYWQSKGWADACRPEGEAFVCEIEDA